MSKTTKKLKATDGSIEAFLNALRHPERTLIDALRGLLAASVPKAVEHIKWNAPSFAKSEHFATLNLRAKRGVQLILHLGAKPRADLDMRTAVADPTSVLEWKGPQRAVVSVHNPAHLKAIDKDLRRIVKAWAQRVD